MARKRIPAAKWRELGFATIAIVVVWGVVLPRIERAPSVQARIKQLDDRGIDPAAFFYTDHQGMRRWEANIHEAQRRHPEAFW